MSVGVVMTSPGLERLNARLQTIGRVFSGAAGNRLLEAVGAIVESQTRRRISDEKTTPQGKKWEKWSDEYAASKHGADKGHAPHPGELRESQGHSLLVLDGGLLDSIQFLATGTEVEVGSNLVYANRQNAQRQYLGVSRSNEKEIIEIIDDFFDDYIAKRFT